MNSFAEFFTESYLGRNDSLTECEGYLDSIIKLVKEQKYININKSEYNKKLCETLQKQFGFKRVSIYWRLSQMANAATFVNSHAVGTALGTGKLMKDRKKGYYDTTHTINLSIIVNIGMIIKTDITSEEILAIILHEIGHNFEYSVYRIMDLSLKALTAVMKQDGSKIISELTTSNALKPITEIIYTLPDRILYTIKPLRSVFDFIQSITRYVVSYLGLVISPIALPIASIYHILLTPAVSLLSFLPRKREEFADSFAAAYGYSVPLSTALLKMSDGFLIDMKNIVEKNDFLAILYDIGVCTTMLCGDLDPHGSNEMRIQKMLNKLNMEITSADLSPEIKEDLLLEKKNLENMFNELITIGTVKRMVITKTFRNIMATTLADYRDIQYWILKQYNA